LPLSRRYPAANEAKNLGAFMPVYAGKLIDDSEFSPRFRDIATANWRAQPVFRRTIFSSPL
jgi:hypothetical protein